MFSFYPLRTLLPTYGNYRYFQKLSNVPKKEGDKPSPVENHWIQLDPRCVRNQVSDSPGSVHSKKIFRIV